jgi:hypothetical protein
MKLIADISGLMPTDLNTERGRVGFPFVDPRCCSRTTRVVQLDNRSGPVGPDRHP